jgi:hypothetical protein
MSERLAKILISGGAVSIALVTLFILYKVLTNDLSHLGKYINGNTEVLKSLEKTVEANTLQGQRLERVIDKLESKIR